MSDSAKLQVIVASAERAAAVGEFADAERLLREAVALQEIAADAPHADLANTLNNLGVVCEHTGNLAEAERCYRRASAIAAAALPPDHPFVATSRRNLAEFCAANNLSIEQPAQALTPSVPEAAPLKPTLPVRAESGPAPTKAVPAPPAAAPQPARAPAQKPAVSSAPPAAVPAAAPRRAGLAARRLPALAIIGAIAGVIALTLWLKRDEGVETSPRRTTAATAPVSPAAPAPATAPDRSRSPKAPASAAAAPSTPERSGERPSASAPAVVDARLCGTLVTHSAREWTCTPPADPVGPGPIYLYARVKSPRDLVVVHRWYRGNRLEGSRELQIQANESEGYRTYSRHVLSGQSAGDWRVELTTRDGRVLYEARFAAR